MRAKGIARYNGLHVHSGQEVYGEFEIEENKTFILVEEEDEFGNIIILCRKEVFAPSVRFE